MVNGCLWFWHKKLPVLSTSEIKKHLDMLNKELKNERLTAFEKSLPINGNAREELKNLSEEEKRKYLKAKGIFTKGICGRQEMILLNCICGDDRASRIIKYCTEIKEDWLQEINNIHRGIGPIVDGLCSEHFRRSASTFTTEIFSKIIVDIPNQV